MPHPEDMEATPETGIGRLANEQANVVIYATGPPVLTPAAAVDRKSTRLNSSHIPLSRMPSSA